MSESSSSDNQFGSSDSNSLNDSMANSSLLAKNINNKRVMSPTNNSLEGEIHIKTRLNENEIFNKIANSMKNHDQQVNQNQLQFNKINNKFDNIDDDDNEIEEEDDEQSDTEESEDDQDECNMDETENEENDDDDDFMDTDDSSSFSSLSGFTEFFGQGWKAMSWIQCQMTSGANPRDILSQILMKDISQDLDDMTLWKILASMLTEPPRRQKLSNINTIEHVVKLLNDSKKIIVLTGAGVSVSCGIPDFRSADGIYARLAEDYPDLPDPQAMFDIQYFSNDPRPFFKFAREIYPGQFKPSLCHRFIKFLEHKGKLLRNYTQNIDTLEQVAGICNVIECHGSFATASCTNCKLKQTANEIKDQIFSQRIPVCQKCQPNVDRELLTIENKSLIECTNSDKICKTFISQNSECCMELSKEQNQTETNCDIEEGSIKSDSNMDTKNHYKTLVQNGIMKPDIVFFGEGLPDAFHSAIADDKDECDLLIVIGSSLKVRPVALIPNLIPPHIPQVLINLEQLPHMDFDVELIGDSDTTINHLCQMLGEEWLDICPRNTEKNGSILPKECNGNSSGLDTKSANSIQKSTTNEKSGIENTTCFEDISILTKKATETQLNSTELPSLSSSNQP